MPRRKWSREAIIAVQKKHEKFFDLYYMGVSKKKIAVAVARGSVPLLEMAFPTINFSERGSVPPEYVNRERWLEQKREKQKVEEEEHAEVVAQATKKPDDVIDATVEGMKLQQVLKK